MDIVDVTLETVYFLHAKLGTNVVVSYDLQIFYIKKKLWLKRFDALNKKMLLHLLG